MNMSYCRFQNTLKDLQDCSYSMTDDLSEDEQKAQRELIALCIQIAADYGDVLDQDNDEQGGRFVEDEFGFFSTGGR